MKNVTRVRLDNRYTVGNVTRIARTPLDERFVFKTTPLYQYDYGQILKFDGVTLPDAYEVHFSNQDEDGTAKIQIGTADGVAIPDEYLLTGESIYVWIFLHAGEDDGETEYKIVIPVRKRAQVEDVEPTPVQQDVITETIASLNSALSRAETAQDAWENMTAQAETLAPESEATASYADGVLTLGIPEGKQGEQGNTGNGIASTILNPDYTLTINFTDGTSYTTESIRGAQGNDGDDGAGIASMMLNADYTLTITLTDGTSYTTPSIRGEKGDTGRAPQITATKTGSTTTIYADGVAIGAVEDGEDGIGVPIGGTAGQVLTKRSATDGDTEWQDASGGTVTDVTVNGVSVLDSQTGVASITVNESQTIAVSGTEPVISAVSNARYVCGELTSLTFTPSATGICDVIFTSGTTATVLNLPSTVILPEWFEVEANHTYEISIVDGVYGAVMVW